MGNVLLQGPNKKGDPASQYQRWLQQNPDLLSKQILSENKLFRTSSYRYNGRNIIIKVYFRRDQSSLTQFFKIFELFNQFCQKYKAVNIMPVKLFNQRDNQAFVVAYRQKVSQTLEDVILAKPTPSQYKKKWLIYQMIKAVYILHNHFNFYHGHIRTSNFVITTYGYLMLTDFAFYKPLYMLQDSQQGLPQFRLFYGSSVNNCTLAPQKITEQADLKNKQRSPAKVFANYQPVSNKSSNYTTNFTANNQANTSNESTSVNESIPPGNLSITASRTQNQIQKPKNMQNTDGNRYQQNSCLGQLQSLQKMDIFSLGCSILEVLRDGKPLLNFQSYLQFKKGQISIQPFIQEGCKQINAKDGQTIKKLLKSMLSLTPEDRPNIEQIMNEYNTTINIDLYCLIWHCTSAFTTTSFLLPDLRIQLIHSIFKFIESQQRANSLDFKVKAPKCFQSLQALKIFKSIIKNKIFQIDNIPQNSILKKLIESNQNQNLVDSQQQQQVINEESDMRKQFFVPIVGSRKNSSMRMSTATIPKLQKLLTPPQWSRELKSLIQPKFRGVRLTPAEILKNRFQDLLEQCKRNQSIRQFRIKNASYFYKQYNMVVRIVYSCIRGCKYNSSKLVGIEILMTIAKQTTDSTRLTKMVPLLISLLQDSDSVTSKYAFNSLVDIFYMFIDPFKSQEDTPYYDIIIQMLINSIKTSRLRINLFKRISEIYYICEWLQIHIKRLSKKITTKNSLRKLVEVIKNSYGSYSTQEVRQLMMNIPDIMWPDMFEFFISFLNTQKILGLQKGISIAHVDVEYHKKIIDVIDSCIQSSLDQNGFSLFYAIKYFTVRKIFNLNIVKKIGPLVIHPHLWVRQQAKQYLTMCLQQNPATRIFFLFREVFSPPFPLQSKDIADDILLPQPLTQNQVDFNKRKIKQKRSIGITQKLFMQYLQKVKASKSYPVTKQNQINNWQIIFKNLLEHKIEPTLFNGFIKRSIFQLYQANFLYYVGNVKFPYRLLIKEQQKKKQYEQLTQALKKWNILSLEDNQVSYQKKDFFISFSTTLNSNFQKLLTRFMKQDKSNKIRISESIYLIMETLYKFEQFNIKQTFKLGDYNSKPYQSQRIQKPKGTLITQIYQHRDMISCLQNIADRFLISASYDGTIRIFNTSKIQMNVTTQSEGLYQMASDHSQQKVRINSLAAFQNSYTIAAATNKGNIRVFQIQRMKGKGLQYSKNSLNENNSTDFLKYCVGGQIEKIITFKNQNRNQCFCYITGQGVLGVQDIRTKSKTMFCNFGKQRGLAKSLAFSSLGPSILVGTLDGYILTYDIRCNLISSIRQLQTQTSPISITGIYQSPHQIQGRNLFALTYPSKHYQFSYFDVYNDSPQFMPERHYTSCDREDIITIPKMTNKTKQQNFKLCNNSLSQKIYYKQLTDFNRNFKILEYLSDPFTIKQSKMRQVWMDRCKHRYNQIYSIYNKKSLPFLEHLSSGGILTNMNPCLTCEGQKKSTKNLSVLVDKIELKQYYETQKLVTCRPPNSKVYTFQDEQNADYLTCCRIVGNMVFVGGWDSVIKVYK